MCAHVPHTVKVAVWMWCCHVHSTCITVRPYVETGSSSHTSSACRSSSTSSCLSLHPSPYSCVVQARLTPPVLDLLDPIVGLPLWLSVLSDSGGLLVVLANSLWPLTWRVGAAAQPGARARSI